MFRYIKAMSYPKSKAEKVIESYGDAISNHLIKCMLYKDDNSFDHWVKEISNWFQKISEVTIKPKNSKLSKEFYDDMVFGYFGENKHDTELSLESFMLANEEKYKYIKLNSDLCNSIWETISEVKQQILPMLISKQNYSKEDFQKILDHMLRES